jgi:hypothetical protein
METQTDSLITSAERLNGRAIVITFDDGKCALYSASLLRAALPLADELEDPDPDDPDSN